ncbi:MAG: ribonuclease Z [Sphingobacteriaceae bacterium]
MKFELTILGSSSATPIYNRNPTSQLLNINEKYYLIDCGEGTQQQLLRFGLKFQRIDYIFISHLHGDHYLGLVGLLSSMHLNGRTKKLILFGPPELKEILDIQFKHSLTTLRFPLEFSATQSQQPELFFENTDVQVLSFPLNHRIACTGFKITLKQRLPKIRLDKVAELQIPVEHRQLIKKGFPFTDKHGNTHSASELTMAADAPRSYAYCSDTICDWTYLENIKEVNLLYHESTFLHDLLDRATETYHTTALQAGEIAQRAGVKHLLIGHFSARYRDLDQLLEEAKTVFEHTQLALEGQTFEII